ncbi:MAG: TRAP transporter small permease subunit [Chromatiales bacterium]|nr:TRAP transporter small permease subunit [Chromatiales bacterium]
MFSLEKLADSLDQLNEYVGRAVSWLTLLMVLTTFAVVVLRYLFNIGWISAQESIIYMHALVFMLGASYTLRHDGHVRVDIIYRKLSPRGRAWVDLFGNLLLLFPVCLFIIWVSWDYVANSWGLLEGSREAGGLPGVFLLKSAIPLMALLLLLQGVANASRNLLLLRSTSSEQEKPSS